MYYFPNLDFRIADYQGVGCFIQTAASMEGNCANAVAGILSFVLLLR